MPSRNASLRQSARAQSAGSLVGDLGVIALNLQHALKRADIVVWADPCAEVYFAAADQCPEVDADALVGTYGAAARMADIEADLDVMRSERVPAAMLV